MQPYIIQDPHAYPNCGASQRPIIANSDPVRSVLINGKGGEKNKEQDNKCLHLRWCPSDSSHSQKRRLQWMHKQESMEQQVEVVPARSANNKQVWKPKRVVSTSP